MAEIVNLRRARKDKDRRQAEAKADANRIAFGRTKDERTLGAKEKALQERRLEGHRLTGDDPARKDD
jgi:hypothetical protein